MSIQFEQLLKILGSLPDEAVPQVDDWQADLEFYATKARICPCLACLRAEQEEASRVWHYYVHLFDPGEVGSVCYNFDFATSLEASPCEALRAACALLIALRGCLPEEGGCVGEEVLARHRALRRVGAAPESYSGQE